MKQIGVILNTYKRRNIGLQLEALRGQSVKPTDLLVWRNDDWTDSVLTWFVLIFVLDSNVNIVNS
jgi:hypothetical protein